MELSALTRYFPSYFESPSLDSGKPTSAIFAVCMFLRYVLVMDTVDRRGGVWQGALFEVDLRRHNSRYRIPEIYQPVLLQSSLNINSIQSKLGRIRHGTTRNKDLSKYWLRKKNQRTAHFLGFGKCYKKVHFLYLGSSSCRPLKFYFELHFLKVLYIVLIFFLIIVFSLKIGWQFYRLRLNLGWIGKTEARTWEKRVLLQTSDGRCPSFDHTVPGRQCFNSAILRAEEPASRKTQFCISNSLTFWHSWGTSDATLPYIFPGSPSLSQASRSTLSGLLSAP